MVGQKDGFATSSVETPTIIEENNEGAQEGASSFVIKLAHILQHLAEQKGRQTTLQLVDLLTNTSFEVNMLKWYIKSLADNEAVTTRNTRELIKDDRLCRVLWKGGMPILCSVWSAETLCQELLS